MITFKVKTVPNYDISSWNENYSFLFRKLYANFELYQDPTFMTEMQKKFGLDSWFYQSCVVAVKEKLSKEENINKKNLGAIKKLEELLKQKTTTKKEKRLKFRVFKKLSRLKKDLDKGITFGGKETLKRISFLANQKDQESIELLKEEKEKFQAKRALPILSIGEAPQNSNRKFNFDFENKKVTFKPNKTTKIPIEFHCGKKQFKDLLKLQATLGEQAITVQLSNEYLWITFDNEKLNGFEFKKKELFEELKSIPKEDKLKRKAIARKWHAEHLERKLQDKLPNRYLNVDLNPEEIGISVLDKTGLTYKVIHKECISFKGLNTKLRLSSTDSKQVSQNNKRKFEIFQAWKHIFQLAKHFKVGHFVLEDLDFKAPPVNQKAKEANRKNLNLWHRTQTVESINKYCQEMGLDLILVNPCYSSFIGNIQHLVYDPVASSIEIGRRGLFKFLKGTFFPKIEGSDLDTMSALGLDVSSKTTLNWKEAFNSFKKSGLRYRHALDPSKVEVSYLQSHKSCTVLYSFK